MNLTIATTSNKYVSRAANNDAGVDIEFPESVCVPANARSFKIDLKVQASVDDGRRYLASGGGSPPKYKSYWLGPRSSIGKTPLRQCNGWGLIDRDYTGNLMVYVDNLSDQDYTPEKSLFQVVAMDGEPMSVQVVESLNRTTDRGAGGFGSTNT